MTEKTLTDRIMSRLLGDDWKELLLMTAAFMLFVTMFIGPLYNGFLVSLLWNWFVVPLGLPQLNVLQAAGIFILIALVTGPGPDTSKWTGKEAMAHEVMKLVFVGYAYGLKILMGSQFAF
ncbi:hypothetical protein [Microvirga arabica]|uniref:hypothetical protein n=1 Tax=Microvirga arabica TaxID=1128671 RepID=UPI00193A3C29|nr:hypothetical protein [Microvirga arabica]MBM1172831.1 hypothetical protein [Microvirga arabica]